MQTAQESCFAVLDVQLLTVFPVTLDIICMCSIPNCWPFLSHAVATGYVWFCGCRPEASSSQCYWPWHGMTLSFILWVLVADGRHAVFQASNWRWHRVNLLKKKRSWQEHLLKLSRFWMSWVICTREEHHTALMMIDNNKLIGFDWKWR